MPLAVVVCVLLATLPKPLYRNRVLPASSVTLVSLPMSLGCGLVPPSYSRTVGVPLA